MSPEPLITMECAYTRLKEANPKAVSLSILPGFSKDFIPQSCTDKFPVNLTRLYDPKYLTMSYDLLLNECDRVFGSLDVSVEQAENLEQATRMQSKSRLWFRYRAGRITASRFKAAVSTDADNPSPSLIKAICYPGSMKIKSRATW